MTDRSSHPPATTPEDLGRLFVERASAGDVEGVLALYEDGATLALRDGHLATGSDAIRTAYTELFAVRRAFTATGQWPALVFGEIALTSSTTPGGSTAEVARRQPDGSWLWILDRPTVTGRPAEAEPGR